MIGSLARLAVLALLGAVQVAPASAARVEMEFLPADRALIPQAYVIGDDSRLDDRERALRRRLAAAPQDAAALAALGGVLFRRGAEAEAREAWDGAAALDPSRAPADVLIDIERAFALQREGDEEGARAALTAAAERHAANPHFHLLQAEQAMRARNFAEAEAAYAKARALAPDLYVTSLNLGRMHEFLGRQDEARRFYEEAAATAPGRAATWDFLGAHQFRQGRSAEAEASLRRAEAAEPTHPLAEVRLAELHAERRDYIGARHWYAAALERAEGGRAAIRVALSDAQLRLGLPAEAGATLDAVLAEAESAPVLVARARVDEELGDVDAAIARYRRAFAVDPGNVVASNNLAMALIKADRDPDEALLHAGRAFAQAGENALIYGTHALALAHAGRPEARVALDRAVRIDPADPWLRFFFGRLLAEAGEAADARLHLEAVAILDPAFPRSAEVGRLLAGL